METLLRTYIKLIFFESVSDLEERKAYLAFENDACKRLQLLQSIE